MVTDPKAVAAAQAAATAQQTADQAVAAAMDAMAEARYAPRIASRPPTVADGASKPVGAGWNEYNSSGLLVQMWRWDGTAWRRLDMSPTMIPVLQIGTGTAGDLSADRVTVTGDFAARLATIIELNADRITSGTIATGRLNASEIAAAVASVIQLDAGRITSGTIDTARLNATAIAAAVATVIQLNASRITTGTLDTARLNAAEVAATVATIIELNASRITSGTISTARLDTQAIASAVATIIELNASRITTGTLGADRIAANSITAAKILVDETLAAKVVQAMTVATKRLVVTDDAILNRATIINGLAADVVSAATIYASQLVVSALDADGNLKPGTVDTVQIVDGAVRAAQIHAEEVAGAVARFLTIEVGQLTAGTAAIDTLVAQKIAGATASFQEAYIQNLRSNGAVMDEAVIGDLAANIITSGLFRTAAEGQRLEIDSNGLIMWGVDPDAGDFEMVRLGPSGENLLTIGETTIAPTGVATPQLNTEQLTVGGETLAEILEPYPRGVVAWGEVTENSSFSSDPNGARRAEIQTMLDPGRLYRFSVSEHYANTTAATARLVERLKWSLDGTPIYVGPSAGVTEGRSARHYLYGNSTYTVPSISCIVDASDWTRRREFWGMFLMYSEGTSWPIQLVARRDYPLTMTVEDLGPSRPGRIKRWNDNNEGGAQDTSPTLKPYTKVYVSNGYRCYNQDGSDAGRPDVVHGLYAGGPTRHLRRGGWTFPSMTADLAGATIDSIRVYLPQCAQTHSSAGSTVNVATWGGQMVNGLSAFTSLYGHKAGPGRWVSVPRDRWAGFKSGAIAGFGVIPTSTSTVQYARFAPTGARIEIKYVK